MNAECSPSAGWRVARITTPIRRIHSSKIAVADVGIEVQQAPERAGLKQASHLFHRRFVPPFMADAEDAAGFGAGSQNPLGACGRESEWLFTEHVFACAKMPRQPFLRGAGE